MTERGLIRSAAQVRALLAGATQVRVPVVPQPNRHLCEGGNPQSLQPLEDGSWAWLCNACGYDQEFRCPLGAAGDRLYCRETWGELQAALYHSDAEGINFIRRPDLPQYAAVYRADFTDGEFIYSPKRWRSPATMPRWASRLILEVVEVRAQRGVEVLVLDIEAEGIPVSGKPSPGADQVVAAVADFENSWDRQYAKRGLAWSPSIWTFVGTVRRVQP